jgi:hypothetical protein
MDRVVPGIGQRWLISASLLLAALLEVILAFRERATADFFIQVANYGYNGSAEAKRAALETASSYITVFWVDLAVAALLVLIVGGVLLRSGPTSYLTAGLVAGFAGASGLWALFGDQGELGGQLPVGLFGVSLAFVGGIAVVGSIAGWVATAPPGHPRPLNPPVPPSHEAG